MTKIRVALGGLLVAALLAAYQNSNAPAPAPAQTTQPVPPRAQFFAGAIVELDATHVKVSRTLVGRPTESRSFTITPATKMNKTAIKLHTRVTVRYKHLPDTGNDIALEIQPHPVIVPRPKS